MVRGDWSRDQFPRQWHDRFYTDAVTDEARHAEPSDTRRQPPVAIEKALREHCGIAARYYFVAAVMEDGSRQTFSGPGMQINHDVARQMFNWNGFAREIDRAEYGVNSFEEVDSPFAGDAYRSHYGSNYGSGERTRRTSELFNDEELAFRPRKRNRYRRPGNEEEDIPAAAVRNTVKMYINDADAVWKLYDQRFRNCQQTACKLIAKAWVKVVEPKKQTNHPYTGKDEKAPNWWPKPWGNTKEEKVRHKEPDHLYKRERVYLLCHILRMVVQPVEKQHPSIAKLGLNVQKLKEATDEALSSFFFGTEDDKVSQKNSQKKPYLDEIFKVARLEERYKNGQIDGDTEFYVMSDKSAETSQYQTDEGGGLKDEVDDPSGQSSASPPKAPTSHEGMPVVNGPGSEHSNSSQGHLQGNGFLNHDLTGRGTAQYPAGAAAAAATSHMMHSGMPAGDQQFMDECAFKVQQPPFFQASSHRRSSMYSSQADYPTNPPSTGLYGPAWSAGSAAPGTTGMYAFPPQQTTPPHEHYGQAAVPMGQGQYMPGAYDATILQRGTMDQSAMYRSTAATNQAVYGNYLTSDGRDLGGSQVKADTLSRGPVE